MIVHKHKRCQTSKRFFGKSFDSAHRPGHHVTFPTRLRRKALHVPMSRSGQIRDNPVFTLAPLRIPHKHFVTARFGQVHPREASSDRSPGIKKKKTMQTFAVVIGLRRFHAGMVITLALAIAAGGHQVSPHPSGCPRSRIWQTHRFAPGTDTTLENRYAEESVAPCSVMLDSVKAPCCPVGFRSG